MIPNKKVLVGCPLIGGGCDAFRRGYAELMKNGVKGWDVFWSEGGPTIGGITIARNYLAGKAIREDCDVLLFLAGDVGYKGDRFSEAVTRILSHFERDGVDVVGGVQLFKKFPLQVMVAQDEDRAIDEHGLIEVEKTGTDFLAIRVKAMQRVIEKWASISSKLYHGYFPLSYDSNTGNAEQAHGMEWNIFGQGVVFSGDNVTTEFLPEDFYWCRLAREAGMKVMVDTQLRLQHWGQHNYDASTVQGLEEALTTAMPKHKPSKAA